MTVVPVVGFDGVKVNESDSADDVEDTAIL